MTSLQKISQQDLTRSSILWFSAAFMLTIIPQLIFFLPIWVALIFVGSFAWRIQIFRMRLSYPHWALKILLLVMVIAILYGTKGNFLNTEGCAILFMAVYALKFVEAKTIRDGYILSCIGFIALAIIYLFDNSAYVFIFSLLIFITLITAMMGLQEVGYGNYSKLQLLKNSLKIIGLSLPLMVLLFIIFPRFPSMLPNQGEAVPKAQTGVSDSMNPGSIAELANSDNHILWAEFTSKVPPKKDLYWRSLTLDYFDGKGWRQTDKAKVIQQPKYILNNDNQAQKYSVILDPTHQKFLATLDLSILEMNHQQPIFAFPDFHYETAQRIDSKLQYSSMYHPNANLLESSNHRQRGIDLERYTQVTNNNPKTTELLHQLQEKSGDNNELVRNILREFNQGEFSYTMQPGLMVSVDNIDEFMFDHKAGFCEHYASATAFMLRQAGIPARVVIGYLGGAVNDAQNLVEVRGKDAHAWVEYWDNNQGWLRVDPTSAVAPDRIEMGVDELITSLVGDSMGEQSIWQNMKTRLTNLADMIDYRWAKMILGYQGDSQQSLLSKLFKMDYISIFTLVKISFGLLFGFVLIQVIWFFKPWQRFYFNISKEYQKVIQLVSHVYGLNLQQGIAPVELVEQIEPLLSLKELQVMRQMRDVLVAYLYQQNNSVISQSSLRETLVMTQKTLKAKRVRRN